MFLLDSHSACAISKECVTKTKNKTKYDKSSNAYIGTISINVRVHCQYEYTVSTNILQYYAIIGWDARFFYINGRINPFKEVLKKSGRLGLIE